MDVNLVQVAIVLHAVSLCCIANHITTLLMRFEDRQPHWRPIFSQPISLIVPYSDKSLIVHILTTLGIRGERSSLQNLISSLEASTTSILIFLQA